MATLSNKTKTTLAKMIESIVMYEQTYTKKTTQEQPWSEVENWVIYAYQARLELFDAYGVDTISLEDKETGYKFTIQDARDRVKKYWDEKREEYRRQRELKEERVA